MMDRRSFLLTLAALATACAPRRSRIAVGSKNFTEQLLLGELLAQYLERLSLPVERRFYLAGTYICHQALLAGRIDLYVEYSGTALEAILKHAPMSGHERVFELVRDEYARRFDLLVLPPLGFDNSFAMVVRGDDARRLRLSKLSDLAKYAPEWRIGVGYEFLERKDGYPGLVETYSLRFARPPQVMDLGLLYRALQNRQVDIIAAAQTDGLIQALDLAVLDDDRSYFPPYDAIPIVRRQTLDRFPQMREAFNRLAGRIGTNDMRRMNYAIDGKHEDAHDVAASFLANSSFSRK
jgi:glycine betaine/choline ABC-type transport system substrate-binding protein